MTLKNLEDENGPDEYLGAQNPQDNDDDEEQEQPKKQAIPTSNPTDITLQSLTKAVQGLQGLVAQNQNATTAQKQQASRFEQELAALAKDGYKEDSLAAMARVIMAKTADIEEAITKKSQADALEAFNERCRDRLRTEVDAFIEATPSAKWAKDALYARTVEVLQNEPEFEAEHKKFLSGNIPDFKKAFRKVSAMYLKESGMKQGDKGSGEGIDTKNSRTRPSAAISKDGKVDVTKLNDAEREVYTTTLNTLGGKNSRDPAVRKRAEEIARNAVIKFGNLLGR